ncbi:MAG: hypothetical protein QUS09_08820, partial [Methanotrichaceae archaeon]|nr:hypothetical protein [Methanotrichaceae archaeon]
LGDVYKRQGQRSVGAAVPSTSAGTDADEPTGDHPGCQDLAEFIRVQKRKGCTNYTIVTSYPFQVLGPRGKRKKPIPLQVATQGKEFRLLPSNLLNRCDNP